MPRFRGCGHRWPCVGTAWSQLGHIPHGPAPHDSQLPTRPAPRPARPSALHAPIAAAVTASPRPTSPLPWFGLVSTTPTPPHPCRTQVQVRHWRAGGEGAHVQVRRAGRHTPEPNETGLNCQGGRRQGIQGGGGSGGKRRGGAEGGRRAHVRVEGRELCARNGGAAGAAGAVRRGRRHRQAVVCWVSELRS